MTDRRQRWGATSRNADPILNVLRRVLPDTGTVLEVASGTGQHAAHFSSALTGLSWLPSEYDIQHFDSINAWRDAAEHDRVRAPVRLDVTSDPWPIDDIHPVQAIVNINMIHIAPWAACLGLFSGAERHLAPQGVLFLYGPYRQNGTYRSDGDAAFDRDLRSRNPSWGIRDLEAVTAAAADTGFTLNETIEMPANNLSLVFRKERA